MDTYFMTNAILSKFSRNYMNLKKDLPVRPSEMGVLNILAGTSGPHTALMLKDLLGVSKPMIAAHISVLEKKGYITKRQSPNDKRVFFLEPTEKAMALVEDARRETQTQLDVLSEQLGAEQFAELVRLAEKANHIMEKTP